MSVGLSWFSRFWFLYIPHGSDESYGYLDLDNFHHNSLYPTWFRWKQGVKPCFFDVTILYIPHGSDESRYCVRNNKMCIFFISHMVQMKERCLASLRTETFSFISHMVQMKADPGASLTMTIPGFISHMVQMKVCIAMLHLIHLLPLYPTWFRWKLKMSSVYGKEIIPLYPTWFRWKVLSLLL